MIAVWKHEMRTAYHSLMTYLICGFFLALVGVGAMYYNIEYSVSNFEYVLQFVAIGLVFLIPVLTMHSFAEERKQKTDQLLYALPLRTTDIVLGKYLALTAVFFLPLLFVAVYPLVFAQFGEVYLPTAYGSLLAFALMGCACIAVGLFISTLTDNLGFAAGIAMVVLLFNYFSVTLAEKASSSALGGLLTLLLCAVLAGLLLNALTHSPLVGCLGGGALSAAVLGLYAFHSDTFEALLPTLMKTLSLFERFDTFVNGIFDVTALVFYLSVIVFFLFLSVQSLEKRPANKSQV